MHLAQTNSTAPLTAVHSSSKFTLQRIWFKLHPITSITLCLAMSIAYVGILYALPRNIRQLPRDHPTHIVGRMFLILILCCLCPFILAMFTEQDDAGLTFAEWLGFRGKGLLEATIVPLFVTIILFAGPIICNSVRVIHASRQYESDKMWNALKNSVLVYKITREHLQALRNYIVGPLTEEFVFRSCMIPLLVCCSFTQRQIIFGVPLSFGFAHLHHFVEHIRGGRSLLDAAMIVGFQLSYTTLFGAYAAFIFLRTGHLISAFLVHMFCNMMGFPDVTFFNPDHPLHSYRIVLLATYLSGLYGFSRLIIPWTDPSIYKSPHWNITVPCDMSSSANIRSDSL